uniref:Uncharacterized protein n=1 Tax=Romanomermis culicivorax TaxID=13658 RepID=A0A915KQK7_ROMCU
MCADILHCTSKTLSPTVNPFGFLDYLPDDYCDHPQPRYNLQCMSHCEEDSRIETIVDTHSPSTEP